MNSEKDFKDVFCKSVEKQGGYTFKIAMSSMSGLPDLYCAMAKYVPVLLEAKWIKDVPVEKKFKQKIKYRAYQREILKQCNKPYTNSIGLVGFGLLGIHCEDDTRWCILMNPDVQIITHDILADERALLPIEKDEKDKWFVDVDLLFYNNRVIRL